MKVIFLCTANSARSILAEAMFRELVGDEHLVYSCGAQPSGRVNPLALEYLANKGVDVTGLYSKSYQDVPLDGGILVAVCDHAANDVCPVVGNRVHRVAMPLPDPGAPGLSADKQRELFQQVGEQLQSLLVNLKEQLSVVTDIADVYPPQLATNLAATA